MIYYKSQEGSLNKPKGESKVELENESELMWGEVGELSNAVWVANQAQDPEDWAKVEAILEVLVGRMSAIKAEIWYKTDLSKDAFTRVWEGLKC